jgi:hypothetical protein
MADNYKKCIGGFESVSRFARKYGKPRTRYTYLQAIHYYYLE